jgi:hypothetical protein
MTTTATRPDTTETTRTRTRRATAASMATDAAGVVKVAAEDVAGRLPAMAVSGRAAFDDANRRIASSSDEMVRLGTAVSFGFASGLLIGGANRILVGAAFVPVAMLGLALLERSSGSRSGAISSKGVGGL